VGVAATPYIEEEHCHEDPDYSTSLDRDPRNVRGREDPATQGRSRRTQQLREPQRGDSNPHPGYCSQESSVQNLNTVRICKFDARHPRRQAQLTWAIIPVPFQMASETDVSVRSGKVHQAPS
jgi:hypothetical protein